MLNRDIGERQTRCIDANFQRRADERGNEYIEGYFAVFGKDYIIGPGMSESIAPGAFTDSLNDDVRCLTDHDTRLVIGRTTAGTFAIKEDSVGLWGSALVNPKDQDAVNTRARVERGDVTQASFGFDILEEDTEYREDGSVHWTIKKVKLYECSVCTFPAYADTNLEARTKDRDRIRARELDAWKEKMKGRLKND